MIFADLIYLSFVLSSSALLSVFVSCSNFSLTYLSFCLFACLLSLYLFSLFFCSVVSLFSTFCFVLTSFFFSFVCLPFSSASFSFFLFLILQSFDSFFLFSFLLANFFSVFLPCLENLFFLLCFLFFFFPSDFGVLFCPPSFLITSLFCLIVALFSAFLISVCVLSWVK